MKILVLNAGSSTQKSCLYYIPDSTLPDPPPEPLWEGEIEWGRSPEGKKYGTTNSSEITAKVRVNAHGMKQTRSLSAQSRSRSLAELLNTLSQGDTAVLDSLNDIDIVGHRVVHGGTQYHQPTLIDTAVKEAIATLIPLAPNHNPAHLEGIELVESLLGTVPQLAVFDTAFHQSMPPEVTTYPIPYHWYEQGIRRYGFHGISHQYCAQRVAQVLDRPLDRIKLITCHLGNGASLTAIDQGHSVNTTMGFTPLEGLMMGTRSGSIDPAIGLYLMREHGLTHDQLDHLFNKESGLKGIFGPSGDMRDVIAAKEAGNRRAQLAFDMYVHRLRTQIGAMAASLGGVDAIAFTAGIGEHSAAVRAATCSGLEFSGIALDAEKNENGGIDTDIATDESKVRVLVIKAQEDWAIARDCWHYFRADKS